MIGFIPDFVEETPGDDREAQVVVLFGGAGPVLLDETDSELAAAGPLQSPVQG